MQFRHFVRASGFIRQGIWRSKSYCSVRSSKTGFIRHLVSLGFCHACGTGISASRTAWLTSVSPLDVHSSAFSICVLYRSILAQQREFFEHHILRPPLLSSTRPDPTCLAFSSVRLTRYSSVGSLRLSWCVFCCAVVCGVALCGVLLCFVVLLFCCFVVLLFCCFVVLLFCGVLLCCVVLFLVLPGVPVSHIVRNTNCNCWVAQWCRGSMCVSRFGFGGPSL